MPFKLPKLLFFLIVLFSHSFSAGIRCGTAHFLEHSQKKLAKEIYNAAAFSGTVLSRESPPFIIYYTTEKPHAVKSESYLDSLEKYLHQAYDLHQNSLGMKSIRGAQSTYFYRQRVQGGLYPVEVIDIGAGDMGDCGTLGLVFSPPGNSATATQISIENNFEFDTNCPEYNAKPGDQMLGYPWYAALKVTTIHELYHSFQTAYTPITNNTLFWAEASATGVEEIGAPEVNDYISTLYNVKPGISMDNLPNNQSYYGYASLYLFLYSKLGAKFDSAIWSYFSKNSKDKFSRHLAVLADSLEYDPEELFHEYARQVFYSGSRADSSLSYWWPDMLEWPTWNINPIRTNPLPAGTFDFVRKTSDRIPSIDSVAKITLLEEYPVWVLSRLLEKEFVPPPPVGKFAAYPNPWNPKKYPELHFKMPEKENEVEIRASNGALIERIKREPGEALDWRPKKVPAPGILYYRTLPYGKNNVLIVSY